MIFEKHCDFMETRKRTLNFNVDNLLKILGKILTVVLLGIVGYIFVILAMISIAMFIYAIKEHVYVIILAALAIFVTTGGPVIIVLSRVVIYIGNQLRRLYFRYKVNKKKTNFEIKYTPKK